MYTKSNGKHNGPLSSLIELCRKYDILDHVKSALEEYVIISMSEWERIVKSKVWVYENRLWHIKSMLYSSLSYLRCGGRSIEVSPWFRYVNANPTDTKKVRVISRIALNVNQLKSCKERYTKNRTSSAICTNCDLGCIENIEHVLFVCPALNAKRVTHWNSVISNCPRAMINELTQMNSKQKASFLITGLNVYTPEWYDLYMTIANFVNIMYAEATSEN